MVDSVQVLNPRRSSDRLVYGVERPDDASIPPFVELNLSDRGQAQPKIVSWTERTQGSTTFV